MHDSSMSIRFIQYDVKKKKPFKMSTKIYSRHLSFRTLLKETKLGLIFPMIICWHKMSNPKINKDFQNLSSVVLFGAFVAIFHSGR